MTKIFICVQRLAGEIDLVRNFFGLAILLAGFSSNTTGFAQERVLGVDISYWNCGTGAGISQANWNTAYSTGNRVFSQIRATRGGTTGLGQTSGTPGNPTTETLSRRYDDSRFLQNITRATVAGMITGPYHFARPDVAGNTGTDEADHFTEMAGVFMRPGYMMPMYDMEATSGDNSHLVQFAIDFSDRLYANMQIRPCVYINGNYSSLVDNGSTTAQKNALAQPAAFTPSVVGPAYPMLWNARYSDNTATWTNIPVQTGDPKTTYTTSSGYYGPWDNYGNANPWSFWQYASVASIPGINAVDSGIDVDVSHGDIEYVRNYLVPAVWWNNSSGDWSNLANWNSGQPVVTPVPPSDQATPFPYTASALPTARLPGAAGSGPTSGQYDTVILERANANIAVTLSTGTHNVRKLYMRETLNITGGSLSINYNPTYRPDDSSFVLHGGPISAQFSGPVTLSGGSLSVHTLQVDTNRIFTLGGGTLTFNTIKLMPHISVPAKILVTNNVNITPLANATAVLTNGIGSGNSGSMDLGAANRSFTVGNGANEIDLALDVPISNGGLIKAGTGTMRLGKPNTYALGTVVSSGTLYVNNTSGSGTGTGTVAVNGGILGGTGIITGAVTVNGGTISPGTSSSIGTLTLTSAPTLNGTTSVKINRNGGASLADKLVRSGGALNYGGTLIVANIGAALVGGETFTPFSASSYSGAFTTMTLPTLSVGLNWYTNGLLINGTLKVNRSPAAPAALIVTNNPGDLLEIPLANLLQGASDLDADTLTISAIDPTSTNGVSLVTSNSTLRYFNNQSVADKFDYTISDAHGGSATGTVQIVPSKNGRFAGLPTHDGASFTLHFTGLPDWTYYVERSTNLPVWLTIGTNVAPANGLFDFVDDYQGMDSPPSTAFYRLRWLE